LNQTERGILLVPILVQRGSTESKKLEDAGQESDAKQSEFLAVAPMAAFSIYLRQRGPPESKPVGAPHDETGSSS
jgi:hypothetical protein